MRGSRRNPREKLSTTCVAIKAYLKMLSQIERIFPTACPSIKIDVDEIVSARKERSQLFREEYFGGHFWDILFILYGHAVNECPVDVQGLASKLELSPSTVLRHIKVLSADGFVCGHGRDAGEAFDFERDPVALTRQGFDNAGTVILRMRRIFG